MPVNADALELYMLELINEERTSRGLNALMLETNLNASAEVHSQWMLQTDTLSHIGVGNSTATQRIDAEFDLSGNWSTAENIAIQPEHGAAGLTDDVADLHTSLMNSPGHRANLLNPDLVYIGIGVEFGDFIYFSGDAPYASVIVTQNFASTQGTISLDPGATDTPLEPQFTAASDNVTLLDGGTVFALGGNDTVTGTAFDDVIYGGAGNDRLLGNAGNDTLNGGEGADALSGGDGLDAVDYTGSRGSLRVDLLYPQINTNVAAGDTYFSIENLIGSQGFDNLRGTLEANWIFGASNVDYIFGRRGDDTLDGGIGDDVLFGGVGADVLIGGIHRDRAQYSESLTALVLDLAVPDRNTGEAAGDTYDSIEDLAGGKFDDLIWGDGSANRLFGREGADVLDGRTGDDYLNGGAHADTLIGGAGDDTLRGGTHGDTFVFNVGDDVIEDFRGDLGDVIRLQASGLPFGTTTRPDYIVSQFGSLRGGDLVLDFGGAGSLTLANVTQLDLLSEYITIF